MTNRVIVATYRNSLIESWLYLLRTDYAAYIGSATTSMPIIDVIYVYDDTGNILYTISSNAVGGINKLLKDQFFLPRAVTLDQSGRIYVTGATFVRYFLSGDVLSSTPELTGIRTYTAVGDFVSEITQADNTAYWSSIAVASDGDIIVTGSPNIDGKTTFRYSADGTLEWSVDNGQTADPFGYYTDPSTFVGWVPDYHGNYNHLYGLVALDSAGNILVTWTVNTYPLGHVSKYNAAGVFQWTFATYHYIGGLAIDSSDNVYIGTQGTTDTAYPGETLHILKISSAGSLVAATPSLVLFSEFYYPVYEKLQIVDNELHCFGLNDSIGYIRYDLDLVELENIAIAIGATEEKTDGVIDADEQFYYLHKSHDGVGSTTTLIKSYTTPTASSVLWTALPTNDATGTESLSLIVRDVETPPLRLPLRLMKATTQGDLYVIAASLPLTIGIQSPRWILEPSQYGSVTTRYRAKVSGSPLLFLAISSFQFRWNSEGRTLTVISQTVDSGTVDILQARPDEYLTLQSGFLMGVSVAVQYVDFLTVPITGVRLDQGSQNSSLTISGVLAQPIDNPQTRIARGISYRNTLGGKRRIRCAVDMYLQPGDTLDLSGETLIVGEISGYASATQAAMEVVEASE